MNGITRRSRSASPGDSARVLAQRFVPPRLRDARWLIGILLLMGGIAGTLGVIHRFDHSTTVWAAKHTLVPGEKVSTKDFVAVRVRIPHAQDHYFTATAPDAVVIRAVAAGDLVPQAALGSARSSDVRTVAVNVDRGQAQVVHSGADVEVWVADKQNQNGVTTYSQPHKLVASAFVSRIITSAAGVVTTADTQSVELVVPHDALSSMINSSNRGDRITLVPLAAGAGS